jgi:hypothetical protein
VAVPLAVHVYRCQCGVKNQVEASYFSMAEEER